MQASPSFWAARPVCVTGGSGFLGFHLVHQLVALGARVRAFGLRPAEGHPLWTMPGVEVCVGDVRDRAAVRRAVVDAAVVFHAAGFVAVAGPAEARMMEVHREGTANVIESAGPEARVVHTSSVVAVGASRCGELLDEDSRFDVGSLAVPYVRAKREAERIALEAAARRDVVVVNPGYLVGPDDHERSVMGRFFQRAWKGRMPLAAPGGLNLADVRDVATGHLLAAERGRWGRRYILGGENLSNVEILRRLGAVAGHRPRALPRLPACLVTAAAHLSEGLARRSGREPFPSLGQARMCRYYWYYRSDRAREELGYLPRPLDESLRAALSWHKAEQNLTPRGINAWWLRAAA
jgi:dihydroflavonol-4-reductase